MSTLSFFPARKSSPQLKSCFSTTCQSTWTSPNRLIRSCSERSVTDTTTLLSSGSIRLRLVLSLLHGPIGGRSRYDVLFRALSDRSIVQFDLPDNRVTYAHRRVGSIVLLLIPVMRLQQAHPVRFYLVHVWTGGDGGRERADGSRCIRVNNGRALRTFSFGRRQLIPDLQKRQLLRISAVGRARFHTYELSCRVLT